MLNLYVECGMVVGNVQEIISFKQNKWLEKYKTFITHKKNLAENVFEKNFKSLLNKGFYAKRMENVRNRIKLEFIKKGESDKIIRQQRELIFNGIHNFFCKK